MGKKWQIIIILTLSLLTRFIFFGHPNETIFDEVHFGKFISGYYTREYFFDIHPPLGKLAIAGFAKLFDFKPEFAFTDIGDKYPDKQYMILRFLPSLAGALLPVVIYLLLIQVGLNPLASFLGGLLIVFENALLAQSRYILLDSFLLLFGFLSFLLYFKSKDQTSYPKLHLILFGFFAGLAVSVKWTGLSFLMLPLLFEFIQVIRTKSFKKVFTVLIPPFLIACLVYFVIFLAHLTLLNKSGQGDPFMSIGFQKTLIGNRYADDKATPSNIFQKFTELNAEMYKANQRLTAEHPYSSPWYSWPLMTRPIYYWVNANERIYLIGNPIIWWASAVALLVFVLSLLKNLKSKTINNLSIFLITGYVINILPFIGVKRVMFLYHYFTAYIFAIMILAWLINQRKNPKIIFGVLMTIIVLSFLFFSPLSYGLELSPKAYETRVWFNSWK